MDKQSLESTLKAGDLLIKYLEKPFSLLLNGSKLNLSGTKRSLLLFFVFLGVNAVFLALAIIALLMENLNKYRIGLTGVAFGVSVLFGFFVVYKFYRVILMEIFRFIYEHSQDFFKRLCDKVVDKSYDYLAAKKIVSKADIEGAFDIGKMLKERYEKTPKLLQKGVNYIVAKIPFVPFLNELKNEIGSGTKDEYAKMLFNRTDLFIRNTILAPGNNSWFWLILVANIVIEILILKNI